MRFYQFLDRVRLHAKLGRNHRRDTRWPNEPGISFFAREPKHQRSGASAVDELAPHPLQTESREMRLRDLMRRACLHEADIPISWQALFSQELLYRAERRVQLRLNVRGRGLPPRARRALPGLVGLGWVDAAVRLTLNATGFDRAQNGDVADATMACIGSDRQAHVDFALNDLRFLTTDA
jgi:hypothetical protein